VFGHDVFDFVSFQSSQVFLADNDFKHRPIEDSMNFGFEYSVLQNGFIDILPLELQAVLWRSTQYPKTEKHPRRSCDTRRGTARVKRTGCLSPD